MFKKNISTFENFISVQKIGGKRKQQFVPSKFITFVKKRDTEQQCFVTG